METTQLTPDDKKLCQNANNACYVILSLAKLIELDKRGGPEIQELEELMEGGRANIISNTARLIYEKAEVINDCLVCLESWRGQP